MKKSTRRKKLEKELLALLWLYREIKGREGAAATILYFEQEIDRLVEILKEFN